ncbi:MAG: hypothetical protein ACR2QM_12745 [Longimicrobiales bacterium]
MWNSRSVQLNVHLPHDVAAQAEEVQEADPEFLARIIMYGLTRRSIYRRLREAEEHDSVQTSLDSESLSLHRELGPN